MADSPIEQYRTPEALRHQRRTVRAEVVGRAVMLLVVVAALAGLFGPGPLSHATATSDGGDLSIDHARFLRAGSTTGLRITMTVDDPASRPELAIDRRYLDTFTVEDVRPTPASVTARGDLLEFVFEAPGTSHVEVAFDLRPNQFGVRSGRFTTGGGAAAEVRHLIYP